MATIFSGLWHRARAFGNAVEEKYPAKDLEQVLEHYFGDAKLSSATTDVLVTAVRDRVAHALVLQQSRSTGEHRTRTTSR